MVGLTVTRDTRQDTSICRDGHHRICTPNRMAIASLAKGDLAGVEGNKRKMMLGSRQPLLQVNNNNNTCHVVARYVIDTWLSGEHWHPRNSNSIVLYSSLSVAVTNHVFDDQFANDTFYIEWWYSMHVL